MAHARVEFPTSTGPVLGWVCIVGLAIAAAVSLKGDQSPGTLRFVACLLVLGVVMHAYLVRPRVRVVDDHLELVNPWTLTRIPLARVGLVLVRSATFVYVGEKRYVGVAVGRTTRDLAIPASMRGSRSSVFPGRREDNEPKQRDKQAETTERQITELAGGASPEGRDWPVTRVFAVPHLVVLGVALVAAGVLFAW